MAMFEIKYVHEFEDRHGKTRWYFRRRGYKQKALRGPVGSDGFWQDYNEALRQTREGVTPGLSTIVPGSLGDVLAKYYQSSRFASLRPATQENYRRNLDRFQNEVIKGLRFRDAPIASLKRAHLLAYFDTRSSTPGASYTLMKRLKTLFDFARERELIRENPADLLRKPKLKGFRALEDADIDRYLTYWGRGTIQSRAMVLLVYAGQRRSDAVEMGRQHIKAGRISVVQRKTGKRLEIPIHPVLQAEIDAMPAGQMMFITGEKGKPLASASFGNMFRRWCKEAGLPENSSPHGARKAAGRRLAEAGCTARQIMSILGHDSLSEAERYTRSADQITLADAAMAKLK